MRIFRFVSMVVLALAILSVFTGCAKSKKTSITTNKEEKPCKTITTRIPVTGTLLPCSVVSMWSNKYAEETGIAFDYQTQDLDALLFRISEGETFVMISDCPLPKDASKWKKSIHIPLVASGVVAVANLPGIRPSLTPELLSEIMLGRLTKWNDPRIVKINPKHMMPDLPIKICYRSDSCGATYAFTSYLCSTNEEWKSRNGCGACIEWPKGIGYYGNEGVAGYVKRTPGSIGYVDYAYAKLYALRVIRLKNRDGFIVKPLPSSFAAAVKNMNLSNPAPQCVNLPGKKSWPIMLLVTLIIPKTADKEECGKLTEFAHWTRSNGTEYTKEMDFIPLYEKK